MSQGKEETTLKCITKNNSNNYCNNNTGNTTTMVKNNNKNSNSQQVMPFYENCTLNHNSRNNNNNVKGKADHHFALQHSPSQSVAFNYEEHFVRDTSCSNSHNAFLNNSILREKSCELSDYEYENIDIAVGQQQYQSDKRLLLQKYFRSALVGPRANIYENLCRGCNYGVFNARGPLCSFCECIVNGVTAVTSDTSQQSGLNESNIYENVCELCGLIYGGSEGDVCKCRLSSDLELEREFNVGSEEQLLEKNTPRDKKTKKINKSKSFSKANRPKIFTTFWETLRKPRGSTVVNIKKPLEIVHHVEGYDQVFHTKDTFDLQRICELKRSTTSCSDQHIYGRVKQHDLRATDEEEFNSTQSLTQTDSKSFTKKPRISKAKFLRSTPRVKAKLSHNNTSSETIYLSSSVCHWMTSLRHEVHAYNNEELECYPKSIPSKNVLNFCKVAPVTNILNYLAFGDGSCASSSDTEIPCTQLTSSKEFSEIVEEQPNEIIDCYQLVVEEFMANILYRQHKNNNRNNNSNNNNSNNNNSNVITNTNVKVTMAGVNSNNSDNNSQHIDIALRQNPMTSTAMTSLTTNHVNNRQKRQGMYLRLEDEHNYQHLQLPSPHEQQQRQLPNDNNNNPGEALGYLQNREHITTNSLNNSIKDFKEHNIDENKTNNENIEHNTVNATISTCISTPVGVNDNDLGDLVSRCLKPNANGRHLMQADKRCAIHERNILEDFEALIQQEKQKNAALPTISQSIEISELESQNLKENIFVSPIKDLKQLISLQQMSAGLNTAIICYDKYLVIFLRFITQNTSKRRELLFVNTSTNTSSNANANTNKRLVRKFQRFYRKCEEINKTTAKEITFKTHTLSSNLKLDLNVQPTRNNLNGNGNVKNHESDSLSVCSCCTNLDVNNISKRVKTRPQVPKGDPKTKLSPTVEIKKFSTPTTTENSISISKMTVPSTNLKNETTPTECSQKEEESIYQPIWQFETKGQVTERYRTDDDYYDLKALKEKLKQDSPHAEIPKILISDDMLLEEEEDHNNWEPDEEFVFTKQMHKKRSSSLNSESISTIRSSSHSSNSSIVTSSSLSGSTITEFASSTATLASALASSLKDYPYRNIGIFYSLTEPQIRAIVYNYDRVHSSTYFNKLNTLSDQLKKNINDSGIGKSLSPLLYNFKHRSASNSPSSSCKSSPVALTKREFVNKTSKPKITESVKSEHASATTPLTIPDSVKAWQRQLLHVNYMEDEEDLIVSECEILRAKETKDVADQSYDSQSPPAMPLFKSRSTENLIDDKKTITERLANMYTRFSPIQRGILNINGRSSPKSEKKAYKINRASQTTSLYLEPKYPIFGAPLEQLELQQNVPRFVVDAIDYIERKDRITQDGIYRACGNKFSIDELKHKLTNAYIYDSKLMTADDIHTVTSLLKQFFRDLPEPVVPQDIYNRITSNLSDKENVDTIRIAIEEMREPNKSTLRFLIKHLTNVAACSSSNRMNASNVAIVWGPSLFAHNDTYDMIGRMNTLTKVLIESYDRIFDTNERLL